MSWPVKQEKHEDDDAEIQRDIANIIKNINVQEYERQRQTEKLDIHYVEEILTSIRQDISKEFTNNTVFVGAEDMTTDNTLYNIRRAYIHYCRLMLAHFIMVKKDVVSDTAQMFGIDTHHLLMYILYGESAFRILFSNSTDNKEEDNACLNCGA